MTMLQAIHASAGRDEVDTRRSRLFAHGALIACLVLQRFGVVIGDSALFISLPLFGVLLGWALLTGIGTIRPRGLVLFLAFASWALLGTLIAVAAPDARFDISLMSLAAVLVTYSFTVIGPGERFDRAVIFDTFLFYVRVIAVLGIVQWIVQFAGVRIFSFMVTVPALKPVLVESQFNFNPIMHYGSTIMRSNGFLLLEPSILSQTLALAIGVDYFIIGRTRYLPLYGLSYLLTFSGTGALSLALAIPFYATLSARTFGRVAAFFALGVAALAIGAIALPDQVASLLGRANELNYSGSSGYARFIGPFLPIAELSHEARALIGYGPGATERYIYHVAGTGNSIAKLIIDYGIIGLVAFLTMFVGSLWRRETAILTILALTTFLVGGGYLVFTPMLVILFLLCIWARAPDAERFR
jgi:hypothetical protein